jgi:hypothetical protein
MNMAMGISNALESSIREYSSYLLSLHDCRNADELEFAEAEMRNTLAQHSRDVRKNEQPTIQLLEFLAESHGKSAIAALGIDPFSMQPIVKLEGDEMMF